jgi:hypothetical protein
MRERERERERERDVDQQEKMESVKWMSGLIRSRFSFTHLPLWNIIVIIVRYEVTNPESIGQVCKPISCGGKGWRERAMNDVHRGEIV